MSSRVVDLDGIAPSVELLRALCDQHGDTVDFAGRLAAIRATERMLGFVTALQHDLLAEVEHDDQLLAPGWDLGPSARWRAEQVGLALGITGPSAQRRMSTATTLFDKLPQVSAALRAGTITAHHARLVARHADVLDTDTARTVDAAVMTHRDDWRTPSQLERAFARTVMQVDPAGAAARHHRARRTRRVSLRPEPDGMSALWAPLSAEQGQAVHKTIDAHARSSAARNTPGDHRTLDERRADALVDLITHRHTTTAAASPIADDTGTDSDSGVDGGPTGDNPTGDSPDGSGPGSAGPDGNGPGDAGPATEDPASDDPGAAGSTVCTRNPLLHGQSADVHITVAWSTLIGLDNAPADLTGYGPIDATTARRIAAQPDSVWRRLIVDPITGRLLHFGRETYTPPQDLQDFVIARDQYCVFPTCDTPAVLCDLDHRTSWNRDGSTDPDTPRFVSILRHALTSLDDRWTSSNTRRCCASVAPRERFWMLRMRRSGISIPSHCSVVARSTFSS